MENIATGHSARAAWKLKLIEDWGGFESTVEASRIDERARKWDGNEEYYDISGLIFPNEQ